MLIRDKKTSPKQSSDKLTFKNIRDKFENNFENYTHEKTKRANLLSTPTKRGRGAERGLNSDVSVSLAQLEIKS